MKTDGPTTCLECNERIRVLRLAKQQANAALLVSPVYRREARRETLKVLREAQRALAEHMYDVHQPVLL